MDVGLIVNFNGLIASAFALLAGVALAVELGAAPKKKTEKNKPAKIESAGNSAHKSRRGRRSRDSNSTDNEERLLDDDQAPESGALEKTVTVQQDTSEEVISKLQRTYVDGLLAPRLKYDVALAILNEYEKTSVSEEDAGLLMATQAYLSATRSGSLTSGAFSTGGIGEDLSKKQTDEIDAPKRKNTRETSSTPRKTGERSRPPTRGDASKKTTTGDADPSGRTSSAARNTRRKNTRPE